MPRNPIVLLSVDFDYFVREKLEWGWEHYEYLDGDPEKTKMFLIDAWVSRYITGEVDVWEETAPDKYADFKPEKMSLLLEKDKGLIGNKTTKFWIGDSHKYAYDLFDAVANKKKDAPIIIIHFDAHTDMRNISKKVDTGNWLANFIHRNRERIEKVYHVLPKWYLEEESKEKVIKGTIDELPEELKKMVKEGEIEFVFFDDLPKFENLKIHAIYFARSGVWTPPHLDYRFINTVGVFAEYYGITTGRLKFMKDLYHREMDWEKIKKARAEYKKEFNKFQKQVLSDKKTKKKKIHKQMEIDFGL